jgi:hypothetical protein
LLRLTRVQVQHRQRLPPSEVPQQRRCVHACDDGSLCANAFVIAHHDNATALHEAQRLAGRVLQRVEWVNAEVQALFAKDRLAVEFQQLAILRNGPTVAQRRSNEVPRPHVFALCRKANNRALRNVLRMSV